MFFEEHMLHKRAMIDASCAWACALIMMLLERQRPKLTEAIPAFSFCDHESAEAPPTPCNHDVARASEGINHLHHIG